jgi:hypothetical protein
MQGNPPRELEPSPLIVLTPAKTATEGEAVTA